jgi:hypothetical protein
LEVLEKINFTHKKGMCATCVCVCLCLCMETRGLNFKKSVKIKIFVTCRLNFCLISNNVLSVAKRIISGKNTIYVVVAKPYVKMSSVLLNEPNRRY